MVVEVGLGDGGSPLHALLHLLLYCNLDAAGSKLGVVWHAFEQRSCDCVAKIKRDARQSKKCTGSSK